MNNTAMDICIQFQCRCNVLIFLGHTPFAGLYDNSHLMIQGSQISSQSEVPFYNPTSGVRFSTSLSTLAIIGLFDSSHPTDYQRVPLKVCK